MIHDPVRQLINATPGSDSRRKPAYDGRLPMNKIAAGDAKAERPIHANPRTVFSRSHRGWNQVSSRSQPA